jgi:DNA-directed RNA polymerase specialized sigma24 family protein
MKDTAAAPVPEGPAPDPVSALFEQRLDELLGAAQAACWKRLPWRPEEHERILHEAVHRTLAEAHAGKLDPSGAELAASAYRHADSAIRAFKRQWSSALRRTCDLPEDELFDTLLADAEPAASPALAELLRDEERRRLFGILRYFVVHLYADRTESQRNRALRDTYIVARHYLRGVSLGQIAEELDMTPSACSYARERTVQRLRELLEPGTGEARSFVQNSDCFDSVSELTQFLRLRIGA